LNILIGGASKHYKHILIYFAKNRNYLKKYNIIVYDGLDNCSWNGGRINREITLSDKQIETYYNNNISIALTFSNHNIDLNDKKGNYLLNKYHKNGNCIILINDDLKNYIRKNYPKYKLIYSITGLGNMNIPMKKEDVEIYKSLEKNYDYIVPRMEHIFDPLFLELNQEKYEIMTNDTCIYGCPYFDEHFKQIANQNKIEYPWKNLGKDFCSQIEECWIPNFNPNIGDLNIINKLGENYGMDLDKNRIKKLLKRGIKSFKITGRENKSKDIMNDVNLILEILESE